MTDEKTQEGAVVLCFGDTGGGHMVLTCDCAACGVLVCCDPETVPSIRVDGKRAPLCRECFDRWNRMHRTAKGLDPARLHPNAYWQEEAPK